MASTATGSGIKQPYHLVEPSPWPIIGTFSAGVMFFGLLTYMHPDILGSSLEPFFKSLGIWRILIGVALVLFTMAGWWTQVIHEAETPGTHSPASRLSLRYGMFLFIASEVMFFLAFFWAFFHFAIYPEHTGGDVWPPKGIHTFDPFDLPLLNTVILLTSGATVTWAHHALREGNRRHLILGLAVTVALGLTFTGVQAYEFGHAPYKFTDGVFPSVFFMATGFHGFHVIIGSIFLTVCLGRSIAGQFTPQVHFGFEAAAWYWHFVDVVWLFLFSCIYWWGRGVVETAAGH